MSAVPSTSPPIIYSILLVLIGVKFLTVFANGAIKEAMLMRLKRGDANARKSGNAKARKL
jgi:hypothetical protein